jgi:hypothetical protein
MHLVTRAEFEIACSLWDGCRDEEELLPVFEQFRSADMSFDACIDRMIASGWIYSMGRLKPIGPELFELTEQGLEACAQSIFAATGLRGRKKRKLAR